MSVATLMSLLAPVTEVLKAGIDPSDPEKAVAELNRRLPVSSPQMQAIRALVAAGIAEGWLCDREGGGAKFSRVSKAVPDSQNYSIDAVMLSGPGVWHRHPAGEIDLCFAAVGQPRFDGNKEGWVVFAPGSDHVPTVEGGTMNILYFLPGGQLEWKKA